MIHQLHAGRVCGSARIAGRCRIRASPRSRPIPGTRIPTLDDVFQLASRGKFQYNIETKSFVDKPEYTPAPEEFVRLVLEKIRKYKLEKRIILQSFDFRTLIAMKKIGPEFRLSALTESDKREFTAISADAGNAGIVSPEFHLVTPAKVAAAHKAGLQVVPWTADTGGRLGSSDRGSRRCHYPATIRRH